MVAMHCEYSHAHTTNSITHSHVMQYNNSCSSRIIHLNEGGLHDGIETGTREAEGS